MVTYFVSNRSRGLCRMLPWLSLALYKLFHETRFNAHFSSRLNLYLHGKKLDFPGEALHGTTCVHMYRSEIINEWYHTSRLS